MFRSNPTPTSLVLFYEKPSGEYIISGSSCGFGLDAACSIKWKRSLYPHSPDLTSASRKYDKLSEYDTNLLNVDSNLLVSPDTNRQARNQHTFIGVQ
ncbi:hypothetical protein ABKN59_011373 [Abortiporus biennis]